MRSKKYKKVYDENGNPKKDASTAAEASKDAKAASGNAGSAEDKAQAQTQTEAAGTADAAGTESVTDTNAAKKDNAAQDNIKSAEPSESKKKKHGKHRKKMKTWKKVVCLVVALVLATAGTGYMAMKDYLKTQLQSMRRTTVDEKKLSIVDVNGYANIVLLGVDSRSMKKKDLKNTNTDCIIIVSIEQKTGKINLISVFRDTYLKMGDTTTYAKINSAFAYGGAAMTMKSLNQAMDLNVKHYVLFNFKMVANVVDEVGGITVNVKQEEIYQLNKYTAETARIIGQKKYKLVKKAGKQTLTGVQAVSYGRIRKGVGDDFKRTNRMRVVVQKVTAKLKKCSISELTSIMKLCMKNCETNLSDNDILALMQSVTKYSFNGSIGFPYNVHTGDINGESYVFPSNLAKNVKRLHRQAFGQKGYSVSTECQEISDYITSVAGDQEAINTNSDMYNASDSDTISGFKSSSSSSSSSSSKNSSSSSSSSSN